MTWYSSNITSGNYTIALSGSDALACNFTTADVYYSSNAGQFWTKSFTAPVNLSTFVMDGPKAVGVRINSAPPLVYYTTTGGVSFNETETIFASGINRSIAMSGNNAILGRDDGLYYSTNVGQTWSVSNRSAGAFGTVAMANSLNAIAGSTTIGIWYTTNGGATWTQSSQTTGNYQMLAISGTNAIATRTNGGIYYSTNSGVSWTQSNLTTGTFDQLAINSTGRAIATSRTSTNIGVYYSNNGGQTWMPSGGIPVNAYQISINDSGAIAGASQFANGAGMYYSTNGGQDWTLSNYTTQKFVFALLSGNNAIAANIGNGIAYSTSPLCFHCGTLVLCEGNIHRPIHELQPGDRVLTHCHGLVPIKHIGSATMYNGLFSKPSTFLYRHKQSGLQVSGEHRMLVEPDAFPDEARAEQKKKYGLDANHTDNQVNGLLMWMACLHPDFERVEEFGAFPMYHLVLEHDNEPMRHYGIYVTKQNLVAETCHEADFYKMVQKEK